MRFQTQPIVVRDLLPGPEWTPARARRRVWPILLALVGAIILATVLSRDAGAEGWPDADTVQATIVDRAAAHGVDEATMLRVANCESRFNPSSRGDSGRSHGLYQLNDLPGTGLLASFYEAGYSDPYDAEQAADYYARVLAGEWVGQGITRWRWSCR